MTEGSAHGSPVGTGEGGAVVGREWGRGEASGIRTLNMRVAKETQQGIQSFHGVTTKAAIN